MLIRVALVVHALTLACLVDLVVCKCCDNCPNLRRDPQSREWRHVCSDCTWGTPFCGQGPCNIFGCGCLGECRTGDCTACYPQAEIFDGYLRDPTPVTDAQSIVNEADSDDNQVLDPIEVFDWFTARARVTITSATLGTEFARLDKNHDGLLTAQEIDS